MHHSIYHMALKSKRQDFAISNERSYGRQLITLPSNAYLIKNYFNRDLPLLTHGVTSQRVHFHYRYKLLCLRRPEVGKSLQSRVGVGGQIAKY